MNAENDTIRAAGCVVWRPHPSKPKRKQVLLIHRPQYLDWTHPKGKVDSGESDLECALREVKEETGAVGEVGAELPLVEYLDHRDRHKTVRYWVLRYEGGEFQPNSEVDQIRWSSLHKAREILSYPHDIALLDHL